MQVIVVDDGSKDGTAEVIARFRASIEADGHDEKLRWIWLRHDKNQGKGAAIRTGLSRVDTELVVTHDADLEYHPSDLLQMVELFLYEDADAVFGSRFMSGGYKRALFFRHALGNKLLTFLCDVVSDLNLTDMETCYKMARADLLRSIPLESSTFDVEPELAIKLAKRGARIFEVPISYSGRTYREGKKIGWKDGVRALWAILRYGASSRIYTEDAHGGEILERLNRAPRFTRWMADVVRPHVGDRVLEIGAGIGNMSIHLMPRSIYWATDVNPYYLKYLETLRPTRPYMHVAYTDGMKAESYPAGQNFDTVVCLNVIEHVARRRWCPAKYLGLVNRWRHGHRPGSFRSAALRKSGRSARALSAVHRAATRRSRAGSGISSRTDIEVQSPRRAGVVAQRKGAAAAKLRNGSDSTAQFIDADFSTDRSMAAATASFDHRDFAKTRRSSRRAPVECAGGFVEEIRMTSRVV